MATQEIALKDLLAKFNIKRGSFYTLKKDGFPDCTRRGFWNVGEVARWVETNQKFGKGVSKTVVTPVKVRYCRCCGVKLTTANQRECQRKVGSNVCIACGTSTSKKFCIYCGKALKVAAGRGKTSAHASCVAERRGYVPKAVVNSEALDALHDIIKKKKHTISLIVAEKAEVENRLSTAQDKIAKQERQLSDASLNNEALGRQYKDSLQKNEDLSREVKNLKGEVLELMEQLTSNTPVSVVNNTVSSVDAPMPAWTEDLGRGLAGAIVHLMQGMKK